MTVPGMTEKDTGNSKGEKQVLPLRGRMTTEKQVQRQQQVLPLRGRMTTEIAPSKTTAKQLQRQQQVLPLRGRMTTEKQVQRQQQIPSGDDNQKTTAKVSAKATADPPASRKDDNQKANASTVMTATTATKTATTATNSDNSYGRDNSGAAMQRLCSYDLRSGRRSR
jgi:hypothetical protein